MYRSHVLVCGGTGCTSSGSQAILQNLEAELKKNGLEDEIAIVKTGCHGLCAKGPIMVVYPDAVFYSEVKPEDVAEIFGITRNNVDQIKARMVAKLKALALQYADVCGSQTATCKNPSAGSQ